MKHIHSSDPNKPKYVKWLKGLSGGQKITNVHLSNDGKMVVGDCFKSLGNRNYARIGEFSVNIEQMQMILVGDAVIKSRIQKEEK